MNLLDFFFPKTCLGCKSKGYYFCPNCQQRQLLEQKPNSLHHLPGFKHLVSVTSYQGVIRSLVLEMKYRYSHQIGIDLASFINLYLSQTHEYFPKKTTLVPIPMYQHKENVRGFNQATIIGQLVAQKQNWGFIPNLLIKSKSTPAQAKLDRSTRLKNLSGSFVINPQIQLPDKSTTIILFDDIYTTGSTLKEGGRVIFQAGYRNLWGLTLAG